MSVLVLNASYEPLQQVGLKHAIRMLVRGVAVVEEALEGQTFGRYPVPRVLRLVRYVGMRWRHGTRPAWSKRGVHRREQGLCAYCGNPGHTIDHVVPQSRGGLSTWENTVLACGRCNNRKGDRNLAQSGMRLLVQPRVPGWDELLGR
jgi:5-methylcytosine-specific restriction endonuclease McrA